MPNMLTKGYSHLDGSLQWYGKVCDDIDDVDGGDNDDDDDSDEFDDVDDRFPKIQFPFFEALK